MQHGPGMHMGAAKNQIIPFETTFKSKRQIAEGTYEFVFEKPDNLHFQAGQHVRMSLINPPETDAEGDKRFFTIVSTPQDADLIFAWRVRDTAFKRVMQHMHPGSKVLIQKRPGKAPAGSFVLHEDDTKPAVFIAGGIGIIPAYAMITDALQRGLKHTLYVFYSNRRPEDAPYLTTLQALAKKNPKLVLIATMTKPEESAQRWYGETGYINQTMIEKYVSDTSQPIYYVSGLLDMVDAMRRVLDTMNINKENIRAEDFDGFKMGDGAHTIAPSNNRKVLTASIVTLLIIAVIFTHTRGILAVHSFNFSFSNPLSYGLILVILLILGFKIFAIIKFRRLMSSKQPGQKASLHDIAQAHNLSKRKGNAE